MEIRPSDIRFSQDSINNVFDKRSQHSYKRIGETLDELCENRCSVYDIPRISVVNEGGKWITADNRRLWVFRELERLGKCEAIPVNVGHYIPSQKRTSHNHGKSVVVRGNPGGIWHRKATVVTHSSVSDKSKESTGTQLWKTSNLQDHRDDILTSLRTLSLLRSNSMTVRVPRSCFAKQTYGFRIMRNFIPGVHPKERRIVSDGEAMCYGCFDKFITKDMYISVGETFEQRIYYSSADTVSLGIYRSSRENPQFVDEPGCSFVDAIVLNITSFLNPRNRRITVTIVYDGTKLKIQAKVVATGHIYEKDIELN